MPRFIPLFVLGLLTLYSSASPAETALPPITEVKPVNVHPDVYKTAKRNEPLKITSLKDASKYLQKSTFEKIKKDVDFDKQFVLIFAWRGSGGDRLTYSVAESFPEQIFFTIRPGFTKDLRSHSRVFILRSNVKWKVK